MSIEKMEIKKNCVIWKNVEIEIISSWSESSVYNSFSGYSKGEKWNIQIHGGPSDTHVIIPYVQTAEKYVRLAPTITDSDIFRSYLSKILGSDHDTITLLFLFSRKTLDFQETSVIISEESDACKELVQSPGLEGLSKDINQLFNKGEYADATLKCGDKSFSVHRNILTARSEVFSAMFQHDMSEKNSGIVDIVDLEPHILELFLQYLYSGKVEEVSVDTAHALYQAAEKYVVNTLKQFCASYIMKNMTDDIVCQALVSADKAEDKKFFDNIASFAARSGGFLKSNEWKDFAEKFPNLALKVYLNQ